MGAAQRRSPPPGGNLRNAYSVSVAEIGVPSPADAGRPIWSQAFGFAELHCGLRCDIAAIVPMSSINI